MGISAVDLPCESIAGFSELPKKAQERIQKAVNEKIESGLFAVDVSFPGIKGVSRTEEIKIEADIQAKIQLKILKEMDQIISLVLDDCDFENKLKTLEVQNLKLKSIVGDLKAEQYRLEKQLQNNGKGTYNMS